MFFLRAQDTTDHARRHLCRGPCAPRHAVQLLLRISHSRQQHCGLHLDCGEDVHAARVPCSGASGRCRPVAPECCAACWSSSSHSYPLPIVRSEGTSAGKLNTGGVSQLLAEVSFAASYLSPVPAAPPAPPAPLPPSTCAARLSPQLAPSETYCADRQCIGSAETPVPLRTRPAVCALACTTTRSALHAPACRRVWKSQPFISVNKTQSRAPLPPPNLPPPPLPILLTSAPRCLAARRTRGCGAPCGPRPPPPPLPPRLAPARAGARGWRSRRLRSCRAGGRPRRPLP
jgi:hypothetical protein